MIQHVLRLLFPPKCIFCGNLLEQEQTDLCHTCRKADHTPPFPEKLPHIRRYTVLWKYGGHVRDSILRYKFSSKLSYAQSYGRMLAMKLRQEEIPFDVITWIPISPQRRFKRGYDQVQQLAKAVSKELGCKPQKLLKKIKNNPPQSLSKDPQQRKKNVRGVYKAIHLSLLQGKRILLLDDVITTGATVSEAAKILKQAGAKEIYCAALAASHYERTSR